jgi:DNA-binding MarR family transcriptional regulator
VNDTMQSTDLIRQGMDTLAHHTFRAHMRFVKSTGLSMAQFGILMQLHYQHGSGISSISRRMQISGADASQLVDKLVQGGFLERAEDPVDRRAKQLGLSEKGREIVAASLAARHRLVDTLIAGLDPHEREQVGEVMRILSRLFQQMQDTENTATE